MPAQEDGWSYGNLTGLGLEAAGDNTYDLIVSLLWTNVMCGQASTSDKATYISMIENGITPGALAHLTADTSFNANNIKLIGLATTGLEYIPFNLG